MKHLKFNHNINDNPSANKNRKKKHKSKIWLLSIVVLITIVTLVILGAITVRYVIKPPVIPPVAEDTSILPTGYEDSAFPPPDGDVEDMLIGDGTRAPEGFVDSDRKEQFYTFIVIGMDEGYNTDTIMVVSYDGINKEANVIGIPRDSKVNVKRKVKKINAAYGAGTLHGGGEEGGINQLKKEIKTIIGFIPDFYICVNLEAFVEIVDAVSGVEVDVPMDMKYDDPAQNLHIDLHKGAQVLNGKNALEFARYRKGNNGNAVISDYQRIENQQLVIKSMVSNLLKPMNLLKIPEFINIFSKYVNSDITPQNMLWFAEQLNNIKGTEALSTHIMPTRGTSGLPMYYEYLDETEIVELVNKSINPYKKNIEVSDLDIIN